MRLIDADKIQYAKDWVVTDRIPKVGGYNAKAIYRVTKEEIDAMPTVDAVPVVRCKGCKYWDAFPSSTLAPDHHECKRIRIHTTAEWFCASGERKDGNHETE